MSIHLSCQRGSLIYLRLRTISSLALLPHCLRLTAFGVVCRVGVDRESGVIIFFSSLRIFIWRVLFEFPPCFHKFTALRRWYCFDSYYHCNAVPSPATWLVVLEEEDRQVIVLLLASPARLVLPLRRPRFCYRPSSPVTITIIGAAANIVRMGRRGVASAAAAAAGQRLARPSVARRI